MGTYILLSTLTAEGRKTVKDKPERILEVNKEIETFGAKVLHQYAVLGPYDFVSVVDAPDNETILRIALELGSRGTINMISMPALPTDNIVQSITSRDSTFR
ncbi:GYD domain-containing protein [Candidatus Bathyarchaeota archaeon]|nr:GYD domain-containing protein [Candidatus Bathyarchaeota archaeon]